jgi:hypothetical protein
VLVFTSEDPDYFISHVDLTRVEEYRAEATRLVGEPSIALLFHHLSASRLVTIAQIEGRVRGAGREFVLTNNFCPGGRRNEAHDEVERRLRHILPPWSMVSECLRPWICPLFRAHLLRHGIRADGHSCGSSRRSISRGWSRLISRYSFSSGCVADRPPVPGKLLSFITAIVCESISATASTVTIHPPTVRAWTRAERAA